MTPEERAALEAERADLIRKGDKRRDEPGFAANVVAIDARVAVIDQLLAEPDEPAPTDETGIQTV